MTDAEKLADLDAMLCQIFARRVVVEQELLEAAKGKRPLPTAEDCKRMAVTLGVPDASPWRPIQTAPRDGTPVDLWHREGFRVNEVWWDAEIESWSSCMYDEEITHWMPIPPPPK